MMDNLGITNYLPPSRPPSRKKKWLRHLAIIILLLLAFIVGLITAQRSEVMPLP